ncbi:hypothetical protein OB919_09165 [Halobacteria archaeon AArc-curdl1]|uniref:Uncharacterized protein n=1 Tax=Natronosalvus hydrolyticus TaxID=2979988 RepID=A0AAP2Z8F7_9EURY|nr:hypothetical protein [Halobacteria archaeon AArc-curdl1]
MRQFVRAMIIPFFMALFPAVWYINRNVTTERLPPYTEPTTELVAIAIGIAVFGSIVFAAILARFRHETNTNGPHTLPYRQRIFQPDDTALSVFGLFVSSSFVWALIEMAGFGPPWLGGVLEILLIPVALPLFVLAPLAIQFHWAVILGLVLCVLWMSFLGNVFSDVLHQRPVPVVND